MDDAHDTFEFLCPECNRWLRARVTAAGRRLRCPECLHTISVPDPDPPSTVKFNRAELNVRFSIDPPTSQPPS